MTSKQDGGKHAFLPDSFTSPTGRQQRMADSNNDSERQPFLAPLAASSSTAGSAAGPTYSATLFPVFNDPMSLDNLRRADRRARRRAVLTVVLGFMMWTLLGLLVTIIGGEGAGLFGDSDGRPSWSRRGNRWPGALPRQPIQDGNITSAGCADYLRTLPSSGTKDVSADPEAQDQHSGTVYRTKAFFQFELDQDGKDGVVLLGRGRFANGPVHVVVEEPKSHKVALDTAASGKPIAEIEVMAIWNDKDLLKTVKVCPLARAAGVKDNDNWTERGVGIYTPNPSYTEPGKRLSFETIIRLPPSGLSQQQLRSLTVHGQNFYPLSVAASPLRFGRVDLKSVNGVVSVPESCQLAAQTVYAYASNGRIEGTFNVSSSLRLESENGQIRASVNLVSVAKGGAQEADVSATTSNGYIDLRYLQHPTGVVLRSSARTSNGDAKVHHQPAFEGNFSVRSLARPSSYRR